VLRTLPRDLWSRGPAADNSLRACSAPLKHVGLNQNRLKRSLVPRFPRVRAHAVLLATYEARAATTCRWPGGEIPSVHVTHAARAVNADAGDSRLRGNDGENGTTLTPQSFPRRREPLALIFRAQRAYPARQVGPGRASWVRSGDQGRGPWERAKRADLFSCQLTRGVCLSGALQARSEFRRAAPRPAGHAGVCEAPTRTFEARTGTACRARQRRWSTTRPSVTTDSSGQPPRLHSPSAMTPVTKRRYPSRP
jgi:hypothetical protein